MATREELLRREYCARIERVIDYIYAHYGEDLSIDDLADVAAFSRFHFHRVFAGVVGETVGDFLKRTRLERAASRLTDHPLESVTEIAMACGFSSPSVFSRAFRERFSVSASEWRSGRGRDLDGMPAGRKGSKVAGMIGKESGTARNALGTPGQENPGAGEYIPFITIDERRLPMSKLSYTVEVKDLPELHVAYARHIGPYSGMGEAFERLGRWAGPRGFYSVPDAKTLAVYHDSPEVTDPDKLRSSACVTVPAGTEISNGISLMVIPGGKFAVAHFAITMDQFGEAWDLLMGEWFPSSGWQPDDRMCYELYVNDPETHPEHKFILDICEPVRPL